MKRTPLRTIDLNARILEIIQACLERGANLINPAGTMAMLPFCLWSRSNSTKRKSKCPWPFVSAFT